MNAVEWREFSHELRNSLAPAQAASALLSQTRSAATRQRLTEIIEVNIARALTLTRQIGTLDCDTPSFERIDLTALVGQLCAHRAELVQDEQITLFADLPAGTVWIRGDAEGLSRALINLLANAVSFASAGDTIRVSVRVSGNAVRLSVEDTGPGFAKHVLSQAFERYVSDRPYDSGDHFGLGLAICHRVVAQHGGRISAQNVAPTIHDAGALDCGARILVELPHDPDTDTTRL